VLTIPNCTQGILECSHRWVYNANGGGVNANSRPQPEDVVAYSLLGKPAVLSEQARWQRPARSSFLGPACA
jgi:hypothetical protein